MELYVERIVMEMATQIWYLTVMIHIAYKLVTSHIAKHLNVLSSYTNI